MAGLYKADILTDKDRREEGIIVDRKTKQFHIPLVFATKRSRSSPRLNNLQCAMQGEGRASLLS
jgi:hypothetical protein